MLLLLLLLLLLEGEAVLIIARKLLQSPTAAWKNSPTDWKCDCASRNNSVDVANYLSNDLSTGNDDHGICIGDLIIFNHN